MVSNFAAALSLALVSSLVFIYQRMLPWIKGFSAERGHSSLTDGMLNAQGVRTGSDHSKWNLSLTGSSSQVALVGGRTFSYCGCSVTSPALTCDSNTISFSQVFQLQKTASTQNTLKCASAGFCQPDPMTSVLTCNASNPTGLIVSYLDATTGRIALRFPMGGTEVACTESADRFIVCNTRTGSIMATEENFLIESLATPWYDSLWFSLLVFGVYLVLYLCVFTFCLIPTLMERGWIVREYTVKLPKPVSWLLQKCTCLRCSLYSLLVMILKAITAMTLLPLCPLLRIFSGSSISTLYQNVLGATNAEEHDQRVAAMLSYSRMFIQTTVAVYTIAVGAASSSSLSVLNTWVTRWDDGTLEWQDSQSIFSLFDFLFACPHTSSAETAACLYEKANRSAAKLTILVPFCSLALFCWAAHSQKYCPLSLYNSVHVLLYDVVPDKEAALRELETPQNTFDGFIGGRPNQNNPYGRYTPDDFTQGFTMPRSRLSELRWWIILVATTIISSGKILAVYSSILVLFIPDGFTPQQTPIDIGVTVKTKAAVSATLVLALGKPPILETCLQALWCLASLLLVPVCAVTWIVFDLFPKLVSCICPGCDDSSNLVFVFHFIFTLVRWHVYYFWCCFA